MSSSSRGGSPALDSRPMQRRALLTKGRCKCGRVLMLENHDGGGFTSHHEAPLCAEYKAIIDSATTPLTTSFCTVEFPQPD